MQINRQKLLDAITAAQKLEDAKVAEYEAARADFDAIRGQDWIDNVLPAWSHLADLIREATKRKKVITSAQVGEIFDRVESKHFSKRSRWSNVEPIVWTDHESNSFSVKGVNFNGKPVRDRQLTSLKACLEAIEDETVTPHALKQLGFDKLEWLFRKAVTTP